MAGWPGGCRAAKPTSAKPINASTNRGQAMSSRNARLGIVVGVDESPAAKVAVQWATRDAELRKIPLTLVHAISPEVATWPNVRLPAGLARWQRDRGRRLVDDAFKVVEKASQRGGPAEIHSEVLLSAAV